MVQGMEDVEQHCRKLFVGAVKWSPAFTEDTEKVQMWYMLSDFMHDKTVNWRRLQSLRKRCEPQPTLSSYMALSLVNIHEGTVLEKGWCHYEILASDPISS